MYVFVFIHIILLYIYIYIYTYIIVYICFKINLYIPVWGSWMKRVSWSLKI